MANKELRVIPKDRLYSLDILRGLDMFLLAGGTSLVVLIVQAFGVDAENLNTTLNTHVEWEGFRIHDYLFPLFMFVSGVAIPFSIQAKREKGVPYRKLFFKILKRMLVLVLLGIIYNGGIKTSLADTRFASVLGQIGIAYFFAALIALYTKTIRSRLIWLGSIIVGVGIIQMFIPVPGTGAGVLTPEGCINGFIDRHILPGKLLNQIYDPLGILCNVSATGITLMGVIAGNVLRLKNLNDFHKTGYLTTVGIVFIVSALLLDPCYPVIKKCWTSTYNLLAGGISLILLSLLYMITDHWKLRKWAFPFFLFGMNAIFVYLFNRFFSLESLNTALFGRIGSALGDLNGLFMQFSKLGLMCSLLYYMYKKRIFLRV